MIKLTVKQQAAVNEIDNNLQIIACAGSGKTEVITRRIAHILDAKKDIRPENIVAFTFTEKAAASLKDRVEKALREDNYPHMSFVRDMYVGTIHGFCHEILLKYCNEFKEFKILDTVKNHLFVSRYSDYCGMKELDLSPTPMNIRLFIECIEKMVDDYDNLDNWTDRQRNVFEKYRACLYEHGFLDFSQLIFETVKRIRKDEAVRDYLSEIKYLVVDEYQDVDDLQEKLISCFAEAGANICVVGDDDQTIYQFRGSNADNMIEFSDRYPNVTQVRLEQNFRCSAGVVDVADTVIRNNLRRIPKQMISMADIDGTSEIQGFRFDSPEEENDEIAEDIVKIHNQGIPYSEIAILVRKGKFISSICHSLDEYGIPYATNSTDSFFEGEYFQRFVTTIGILAEVDKPKLFKCWEGYIGNESLSEGFKYLRRMARSGGKAETAPLSGILREFLNKIGLINDDDGTASRELDDDLSGITVILDDYDEIYGDWQLSARVSGVLEFLENEAADEYKYHDFKTDKDDEDAVQIMTVHKAKGLEFNTVFMPELEEKEFPAGNVGGRKYWNVLGSPFTENKDKYASDIEDERKLFYVAVTRAKQNLFLYFQCSKKEPSRFVKEAASSVYLNIDPNAFIYETNKRNMSKNLRNNQEEISRSNHELAKTARSKLLNYYAGAIHAGFHAAGADIVRIKDLSDEELIKEAKKSGLI